MTYYKGKMSAVSFLDLEDSILSRLSGICYKSEIVLTTFFLTHTDVIIRISSCDFSNADNHSYRQKSVALLICRAVDPKPRNTFLKTI